MPRTNANDDYDHAWKINRRQRRHLQLRRRARVLANGSTITGGGADACVRRRTDARTDGRTDTRARCDDGTRIVLTLLVTRRRRRRRRLYGGGGGGGGCRAASDAVVVGARRRSAVGRARVRYGKRESTGGRGVAATARKTTVPSPPPPGAARFGFFSFSYTLSLFSGARVFHSPCGGRLRRTRPSLTLDRSAVCRRRRRRRSRRRRRRRQKFCHVLVPVSTNFFRGGFTAAGAAESLEPYLVRRR